MPNASCAVFKCANNTAKLAKIKKELCQKHKQPKRLCQCLPFTHFKFPLDVDLADKWTSLINRQKSATDKSMWQPDEYSVVCSAHFEDGRPTDKHPLPTLNMGYHVIGTAKQHKTKRKPPTRNLNNQPTLVVNESLSQNQKSTEPKTRTLDSSTTNIVDTTTNFADSCFEPVPSCSHEFESTSAVKSEPKEVTVLKTKTAQTRPPSGNASLLLRMRTAQLRQLLKPKYQKLLKTDKDVIFYTGMPTLECFKTIISYLKQYEQEETRHKKKACIASIYVRTARTKAQRSKDLCMEDKVLMTLMKLRLGLLHKDLAHRFDVSTAMVSLIFAHHTRLLSKALSPLIVFHTRGDVKKSIPVEYKNFRNLRCIIDCSEIYIQKPSDLQMQAATWSDYKSHNTVKFLIAITPQGSVSYVSELYGGRTSDRHIVRDCKFLDWLHPQDVVLADRGFGIREEVMLKGATLVIPPAKKGASQMTSADVRKTKTVANVRIHVERAIRRIKTFRFLSSTVSITMLKYCNDIIRIVSSISNLQGPLVKSWKRQASNMDDEEI